MPITFQCPHCQSRMTVPDAVAGKRGKCSKCKGIVAVPAMSNGSTKDATPPPATKPEAPDWLPRQATPPPKLPKPPVEEPSVSAEDIAASAFADAPQEEAKEEDFIAFNCPQCDEPVKLALEHAGKRHPCPSCRRPVVVPQPAKKDPKNWRNKGPNLPSGARRDDGPIPDDVMDTSKRTGPSLESLQKAGVVQAKRKPLTMLQKARPFLLIGGPLLVLLVGGWWAWGYITALTEQRAFKDAMSATSEKGVQLVGTDGQAVLHLGAGTYYLHSGRSGTAKKAYSEFNNALERAKTAGTKDEGDALLIELLPHEIALVGDRSQVESDVRRPMAEVQKLLAGTLRGISDPEAKLTGMRIATALLSDNAAKARGEKEKKEEASRMLAITRQVYASQDADRAEGLAVTALELLRAGRKELAKEAAEEIVKLYAVQKDKDRLDLRASVVTLLVALEMNANVPAPTKPGEAEIDRIGRAAGVVIKGPVSEARQLIKDDTEKTDRFRTLAGIAEATCGDDDYKLALSALQKLEDKGIRGRQRWHVMRLVLLGQRAKVSTDRLEEFAKEIPNEALMAWAKFLLLRDQLATSRSVENWEAIESEKKFPVKSMAAKAARLEVARHNTLRQGNNWANTIRSWEDGPRAFGSMGVALGMQGK